MIACLDLRAISAGPHLFQAAWARAAAPWPTAPADNSDTRRSRVAAKAASPRTKAEVSSPSSLGRICMMFDHMAGTTVREGNLTPLPGGR